MNWQDLLLFTPLALGVAGAWFVAWRVSKDLREFDSRLDRAQRSADKTLAELNDMLRLARTKP